MLAIALGRRMCRVNRHEIIVGNSANVTRVEGHQCTVGTKPHTENRRRLPVPSVQNSANRKELAVRICLGLLGIRTQMLRSQVCLEHLPVQRVVAQCGEESGREPPGRVGRREQIATQLPRLDDGLREGGRSTFQPYTTHCVTEGASTARVEGHVKA